jgi:hypothetical protein
MAPDRSKPAVFSAYVINLDRHADRWNQSMREWGTRLPLRRMPASELKRKSPVQSINHSVMRVISTLLDNDDPFVISMEDDAVATPAFDVMWPHMLAELTARLDEWDVVQTGGRFDFVLATNPDIVPVPCSQVFVSVNATTAAQMIIFNRRAMLSKGATWLGRLRKGKDVLPNDLYFTVNGPAKKEIGETVQFTVWHPRVSVTTQSSHISATTFRYSSPAAKLQRSSDRVKRVSDALLPPLGAHAPLTPLEIARCKASINPLNNTIGQRVAAPLTAALSPLLVQGANTYGRYSHARIAQAELVSLALASNRTVVLSDIAACHSEPVETLVDFPTLNMLLPAAPVTAMALPALCAGSTMVAHPSLHQYSTSRLGPIVHFHGVNWTVVNSTAPSGADPLSGAALTAYQQPPGARCTGIIGLFGAVAVLEGVVWGRLRPVTAVLTAAAAFLHRLGVSPGGFVGLHLRLTDIGGDSVGGHAGCRYDLRHIVALVSEEQKRLRTAALLIAIDDPASACTVDVLSHFPNATSFVSSGIWTSTSCLEAQFVQEVLAQSGGFVGTSASTFSDIVQKLRHRVYNATTEMRGYRPKRL